MALNFKLRSGTWVQAGTLRLAAISATTPLMLDVVIAGQDEDYVALLAWLNLAAAKALVAKCADACPPQAFPHGEPDGAFHNQSNFVSIKKWNVDGEKCFKFWANQGTECGICIRVCPYNKLPESAPGRIYFRLWVALAATPLRRFALWLDNALGFGRRFRPDWWWKNRPGW